MYINDLLDTTWRINFHLPILTPLIMDFYHLPPSLKVTKILKGRCETCSSPSWSLGVYVSMNKQAIKLCSHIFRDPSTFPFTNICLRLKIAHVIAESSGREGMKINLTEGKRKRTGTELICSSVYDLISVDRLFSYMVLCLEEPENLP